MDPAMMLSRKAKESIKTALAMTIAYGIALGMDWDRPMWAGFAVAMISLSNIGQSMNKAAFRMFGTLVAMVVALTIIGLTVQDRWLFMVLLSAWVGLCTYMMGGPKNQYFWHVCGFACVIICIDGGLDSVNAFDTAVMRTQETGLGILVYSLVAIFLWPSSSRPDFDAVTADLASTQQQLYRAYFDLMQSKGNAKDADALRAREIQQQTQFIQLLDAVTTDSYEISQQRSQWEHYRGQVIQLSETMERWRESFAEVQMLDLAQILPTLAAFSTELDKRLIQTSRMLAGNEPEQPPKKMDLSFDADAVAGLSSFHKAAFAVIRSHLQHMERLTRSLFGNISAIKGFAPADTPAGKSHKQAAVLLPDLERAAAVIRIIVTMWMLWLAVIYVDCIPGGAGVLSMAVPITMALGNTPQIPTSKLFVPVYTSGFFASLVYIFIMPQLSTFYSLGPVIFANTFIICYLFAAPQQRLGRVYGLAMFGAITSISNEQTYSFFTVSNTGLMYFLVFMVMIITAYIPFSPRPESAFQRLLMRFFRSSQYLASINPQDSQRSVSLLSRWRKAFHTREISTLPIKLGVWGKIIDTGSLSDTTAQQVEAVVTSMQALTYRIQELIEVRGQPQASFLVQQLHNDMTGWRYALQNAFQRLSEDPSVVRREAMFEKLKEIVQSLEGRIEDTMAAAADDQISEQEGESFYRLLGAYRGLSEALVNYSGSAEVIDWTRWREEKFA